jgi:hypothetical protein
MLYIYNLKCAENNRELVESLFHAKGTPDCILKIAKRSVKLVRPNGQVIGMINRYGHLVVFQHGNESHYPIVDNINELAVRYEHVNGRLQYWYK